MFKFQKMYYIKFINFVVFYFYRNYILDQLTHLKSPEINDLIYPILNVVQVYTNTAVSECFSRGEYHEEHEKKIDHR